ncbi:hypothetical protein BBJ66_22545 [Rhizobium sp. RSm-3]|nr:hypothetical protein BBJ66_22545 [Rhizobium sp. RSm-3]
MEAYQGFISGKNDCPYIATSPAAIAWHLGQHLASKGELSPTPDAPLSDRNRIAVTAGRGDTLNVRGYKDALIDRYRWYPDNSFSRLLS